jgi:DNA-binding response OmpR family regulator
VAIVMISETNDEESELSAFTAGADSYVFHPIRCRAFLARIQAILRRPRPAISQPAGLAVEGQSYAVRADGRLVTLTFYEFHVVDAMARNSGRVMSRDDIVSLVWGGGDATSPRLVDIYVQRLRQKLGVYASHIETVRGVGYRFSDSGLEMAKANGMTVQRADPSHDQRAPCR